MDKSEDDAGLRMLLADAVGEAKAMISGLCRRREMTVICGDGRSFTWS